MIMGRNRVVFCVKELLRALPRRHSLFVCVGRAKAASDVGMFSTRGVAIFDN